MLWMETTCNAGRQLRDYLDARDARYPGRAAPGNDRVEHILRKILEIALTQCKALADEDKVSAT